MRNLLLALAAVGFLAGCTATERGAAIGAAGGAAVGAAATGDVAGAAVGGVVGAAAGALIGRASEPGQCVYRDRFGDEYVAPCPT